MNPNESSQQLQTILKGDASNTKHGQSFEFQKYP